MGDVCAGRTSMFQDLVRLLAIKKKSDQKNPVDRHDIFIIEEGHKMKKMIGYCGLDCEKCDAYLATINDDQALREKTAKLWAELNQAPILPSIFIARAAASMASKRSFAISCARSASAH